MGEVIIANYFRTKNTIRDIYGKPSIVTMKLYGFIYDNINKEWILPIDKELEQYIDSKVLSKEELEKNLSLLK